MDLVNTHLEKRLKFPTIYELTPSEEKTIKIEGIETYIYRKLVSKKFRKTSLSDEAREKVKSAIKLNVNQNEPIKITFPFGGYKLWRLPSAPTVDWAEFFTISYYIRYCAPIIKAYEPGVVFSFSSDDVIIEDLDNISKEDTDSYVNSFRELLHEFSNYFPENMKMELSRVSDLYTPEEYRKELSSLLEVAKVDHRNMDPERKELMVKMLELNFNWNGVKDYTGLTEAEREKVIKDSMITHDAYLNMSKRAEFVRGPDKVVIFSAPIPNAINLGSTNVSKAKFWSGVGALEFEDNKYFDRVLSPTQWEDNKDFREEVPSTLIKMKNFEVVPLFAKRFNFIY